MAIFKKGRRDPRTGCARKSSVWTIQFADHTGRRRFVSSGLRYERAARTLEATIKHIVELRRIEARPTHADLEAVPVAVRDKLAAWGIVAKAAVCEHAPLSEHLEAFKEHLRSVGDRDRTVEEVPLAIRKLMDAAGWIYPNDITLESATITIANMTWRPHAERKPRPISPSTRGRYRQQVTQFTRWMRRTGRITSNPLEAMEIRKDESEPHGLISQDDVDRLLEWLPTTKGTSHMTGEQWALAIRFAARTGIRAGSQRQLLPGDFALDTLPPRFVLRPGREKNRKPKVRLIADPDLADALRDHVGSLEPDQAVFPIPDQAARILRRFLGQAGCDVHDETGRRIQWHSLKRAFVTELVNDPEVPLAVAMRAADHVDPKTTLKYGNASAADEYRALQRQAERRQARSAG